MPVTKKGQASAPLQETTDGVTLMLDASKLQSFDTVALAQAADVPVGTIMVLNATTPANEGILVVKV